MWNKKIKDDKGFTGLEAAIVLIAFVVVAAVFSYVMLGAGFFTTQKSQQVVHTGVTQASSSVELSGDVIAHGSSNKIDDVNFCVQLAAGSTPVDMAKTIIVFSSPTVAPTELSLNTAAVATAVDGTNYAITSTYNDNLDNILDKGEKFDIKVITTAENIAANGNFQLQIIPPSGAPYIVSRKAPPAIATVMTLY
jgi:archaeal flagellin FlaB